MNDDLLHAVNAFLSETGMGPSYFGKASCGNSELVERLRKGRPVLNQTETKVRTFMATARAKSQVAA